MNQPIHLLADKHILISGEMLPDRVRLTPYDPLNGLPDSLESFDAIFTRTVTPLDETTLSSRSGRLKFVGSATAGTDHADRQWLEDQGIRFAWAPGCNARTVAEYVGTALLLWALDHNIQLSDCTAGIIGVGHAGQATSSLLRELGLRVSHYDPPRQAEDPDFQSDSLEEALSCDLLSFHTSLTREGRWPTWHWLDKNWLSYRKYRLIINAARGGVIEDRALLNALVSGQVESAVLDVWDEEPFFLDALAQKSLIATPHIAGYSIQAKQRAADQLVSALCQEFDLESPVRPKPDPLAQPLSPPGLTESANRPQGLRQILPLLHPIKDYDRLFRKMIGKSADEKRIQFQEIRTGYPLRQEYSSISLPSRLLEQHPQLKILGVQPSEDSSAG